MVRFEFSLRGRWPAENCKASYLDTIFSSYGHSHFSSRCLTSLASNGTARLDGPACRRLGELARQLDQGSTVPITIEQPGVCRGHAYGLSTHLVCPR